MMPVLVIGFWGFAHFMPAPAPSRSAESIAEYFRSNRTGIRVGLIIASAAATLLGPFFVAVTMQMRRIERRLGPLSLLQLILGSLLILEFIMPQMVLMIPGFRPE